MKYDELLINALRLAQEAHLGHFRWDRVTPYIIHPLTVADHFKDDPILRAIAYLHDILEFDCADLDGKQVVLGDLNSYGIFEKRVIDGVKALTRRKGESYVKYIHRIGPNDDARRVKRWDILENTSMAIGNSPLKKSMWQRYMDAVEILNSYKEDPHS